MEDKIIKQPDDEKEKHPHAWKGTWERPVKVDEKSLDPLTLARMTDHNVRGHDEEKAEEPEEMPGLDPEGFVNANRKAG